MDPRDTRQDPRRNQNSAQSGTCIPKMLERNPIRRVTDNLPKTMLDDSSKNEFSYLTKTWFLPNQAPNNVIEKASQQQFFRKRISQETSEALLALWKDQEFDHNDHSILGKYPDRKTFQELEAFIGAKWKSINFSYQLFVDGIKSSDVLQAFLGDCYFLAVVSSLAAKKGRVAALFLTNKSNRGVYEVVCFYMGERKVVKLDSYFPFIIHDEEMKTFAGTNGKESWVLILEKLFAKEFGSYAAIIGGDPTEAMRFLTGAPAQSIFLPAIKPLLENRLWDLLVEKNSQYLFTCCTGEKSSKLKKAKLIGSHAYTILAAFETKYGDKLLAIRNPWGRLDKDGNGEFNGKWSDEYLRKFIDEKKKLPYKYEGGDDGLFHISFDDFLDNFESVEMCLLHPNFVLGSRKRVSDAGKANSFSLIVEENETNFYIMVNQESERKFSKYSGFDDFEYSEIILNVFDSSGQLMLESVTGKDQQIWTDVNLSPGKYQVKVKVIWSTFATSNKINHFVLNTYGPKNVYLFD